MQVKDLLSKPSSKRKIKVIVKDKAGLLSEQIIKDSGAKKFTSITLVPPTFNVTKKLSIEDGFAPPKIKELHNFFQKKEDWESSGYKVEYDVTGTPFEYNKTKDLFFNKQAGLGSFLITIILKQPLHPDVRSAWSVTITAKNDANLATEGILIEDKTNYSLLSNIKELKPLSSIKNLLFTTDSSGVKIAICDIEYTDFDTNLKVSLKTNDDQAKIGKEGGVDLTNSYEESIELEKHAGSLKDITFIITAKGSPINDIEFEVGSTIILKSNEGYEVTEWFNNGVMLLSPPFKSGSLVSSDVSVENARRNYKLKAKMGRRS
ncbi:MAG: hypothetical protein ACTTJ6_06910 [Treponema sp.]